jgi:hypothetical protein
VQKKVQKGQARGKEEVLEARVAELERQAVVRDMPRPGDDVPPQILPCEPWGPPPYSGAGGTWSDPGDIAQYRVWNVPTWYPSDWQPGNQFLPQS